MISQKTQWRVLLVAFAAMVLVRQYQRITLRITAHDMEVENKLLRQSMDPATVAALFNATQDDDMAADETNFLVARLIDALGAINSGDDEHSGLPTFVFMALMGIYFWQVFLWLLGELGIYMKLDKSEDASRYNLTNFVSYRADYWLSTNTYAKPVTLGTFTLILILLGAAARCTLTSATLGSALWDAWIFVVDTSAHADEETSGERMLALLITVGGMFIFAMMIGLISDALAAQVEALHSGSAPVLEWGHIVILGWSNKLLPMVRELILANESSGGCVITIMAEMEKQEMEALIEGAALDLKGCTIVCRQGNPTLPHDVEHVSVKYARVIIVLSPGAVAEADEADGYALRVLLCLKGMDCTGHAVVELQDVDNQELICIVGGNLVETVVAHDFIGRLIVQSGRQPGLAPVMGQLLGFRGEEFYMKEWPELLGKDFGEILFQFEDAVPIGILTKDGTSILNPETGRLIEEGDQVIVLAEDDDSYAPSPKPFRTIAHVNSCPYVADLDNFEGNESIKGADHTLILGWRRDLGDILSELNSNVAPGSSVTIVSSHPNVNGSRDLELAANGRSDPNLFKNLKVIHVVGNPVSRQDLDKLPLETYRTAFILHEEGKGSKEADCCTVTSLFLLRDVHDRQMKEKGVDHHLTIVSEVLDALTRHQLQCADIHDYVMSNEVVSAALAMVAECRAVNAILKELLAVEGCEIYIHYLIQYCPAGLEFCFYDLMVILRRVNHILLGYVLEGEEVPVINPSNKSVLRTWSAADKLIVLADL